MNKIKKIIEIKIRCENKHPEAIREEIAFKLKFPEYYGHNWDAWEECMRDLDWLHENEVIIQLLNYTSGKERSYEIFNREIQSIPHDWLEATETNQCKTIIFQMVQEVPKGNKRHMERNQETSTKYIQADKNIDGSYSPTEISANLSLLLESYEYGDVAEGNFQVWEYPSGDIYQIEVDRTLNEAQYYTTSWTTDGVKWKPVLRNISNDQDKVKQAYAYLSKQNNSRYNS